MRGKAAAALRLEQLIGENVLLRHRPVGRDLFGINELEHFSPRFPGAVVAAALLTEAVHLAAVVVADEAVVGVAEVAAFVEMRAMQRNRLAALTPGRRSIG